MNFTIYLVELEILKSHKLTLSHVIVFQDSCISSCPPLSALGDNVSKAYIKVGTTGKITMAPNIPMIPGKFRQNRNMFDSRENPM